jgi:hypothetical protein
MAVQRVTLRSCRYLEKTVLATERVKNGNRGGGVDNDSAVHTMQLSEDEAVDDGATDTNTNTNTNTRETGASAECRTKERLTTQVDVLLEAAGDGHCFVMLLHAGGWYAAQPRRWPANERPKPPSPITIPAATDAFALFLAAPKQNHLQLPHVSLYPSYLRWRTRFELLYGKYITWTCRNPPLLYLPDHPHTTL